MHANGFQGCNLTVPFAGQERTNISLGLENLYAHSNATGSRLPNIGKASNFPSCQASPKRKANRGKGDNLRSPSCTLNTAVAGVHLTRPQNNAKRIGQEPPGLCSGVCTHRVAENPNQNRREEVNPRTSGSNSPTPRVRSPWG